MAATRTLQIVLGSVTFCALVALSVATFLNKSSGDATNPVVAAGAAGIGLGLVISAFPRRS
jgi:hypothetical protein